VYSVEECMHVSVRIIVCMFLKDYFLMVEIIVERKWNFLTRNW